MNTQDLVRKTTKQLMRLHTHDMTHEFTTQEVLMVATILFDIIRDELLNGGYYHNRTIGRLYVTELETRASKAKNAAIISKQKLLAIKTAPIIFEALNPSLFTDDPLEEKQERTIPAPDVPALNLPHHEHLAPSKLRVRRSIKR